MARLEAAPFQNGGAGRVFSRLLEQRRMSRQKSECSGFADRRQTGRTPGGNRQGSSHSIFHSMASVACGEVSRQAGHSRSCPESRGGNPAVLYPSSRFKVIRVTKNAVAAAQSAKHVTRHELLTHTPEGLYGSCSPRTARACPHLNK